MLASCAANAEPIPGYHLLEPLGKGGFGEVWKCLAPGGMFKAIKFVKGKDALGQGNAEQELRALEKIKTLRHPFLLSIERIELIDGTLVIVSELADRSLHDLLEVNQAAGRPGVPRAELLGYLYEAAEVLDVLNLENGLQHLDVKPRNLFLVGRHVKVADFGLVSSLGEVGVSGEALGGITPLYAAPEVFAGAPSPTSDQYSLAVTYLELMTGTTPYKAKNARHLMMLVGTAEPDLSRLEEADRAAVARAMSKQPAQRFPSCLAFIEALAHAPPAGSGQYRVRAPSVEAPAAAQGAVPRQVSGLYRRESRVVATLRGAAPTDQVLPGYHLQECLGRGPEGELWRARGPKGTASFVRMMAPPKPNDRGENPLDLLTALDHPALPPWRVLPAGVDRVALISDAGSLSLATRFKESRAAGQTGVPRPELTAVLTAVAQALDELYHRTGLQHLALTPKHLALDEGRVLLLEFGLAEVLWLPGNLLSSAMNPRYAAPELYEGFISDACDQYSLALLYAELLTGVHPFRHHNARQLESAQQRGRPDLSFVPAGERTTLSRALQADPAGRFRSCAELLQALEEGHRLGEATAAAVATVPDIGRASSVVIPPDAARSPHKVAAPAWRPAVDELVAAASRDYQILSVGPLAYRWHPGGAIEHRGWARLVPGMARLKIGGFREQWHADRIEATGTRWRFFIKTATTLWQRCLGKAPGLSVEVVLGTPQPARENLTPVQVTIGPAPCAPDHPAEVVGTLGPELLKSLQGYLTLTCSPDDQERYPLAGVVSWEAKGGGVLTAQTRDLGRNGLSMRTTQPVAPGGGTVTLTTPGPAGTCAIPATVRDCVPDGPDSYRVEVAFGA